MLMIAMIPTRLGPKAELALFRVAQEALMNVHKHADARTVDVRLRCTPDEVVLEIADDGVRISPSEINLILARGAGGVGIAGMRARLEQIGGQLSLSGCDQGLAVRATLPTGAARTGSGATELSDKAASAI